MLLIEQNDKAIIWQVEGGYEIWMKLYFTVGTRKGEMIEPKDEDFGVSAWTCYSIGRATTIYNEISRGERGIRPMTEQSEFSN